ncbi:MAG: TetR/AcrR family transcriptional regulator [Lachnospiraceae bacterium]|nr:TetR/AcrR family transcriptional regulator [Lachnospiraceae bacterium]
MGRRKKAPRTLHRDVIASAASRLFREQGLAATSMDDIAKAADYSKATLYVYFKNKEEIIHILVLKSMSRLYDFLSAALDEQETTRGRYDAICQGLVRYQAEFPLYFEMVLDQIDPVWNQQACLPEEVETYRIGEKINEELKVFFLDGIARGELKRDLDILPTIFAFWGMLSGLIQLAAKKEAYLQTAMHVSRQQFLAHGFDMLYQSIGNGKVERT